MLRVDAELGINRQSLIFFVNHIIETETFERQFGTGEALVVVVIYLTYAASFHETNQRQRQS
jgi:hypothetical protein